MEPPIPDDNVVDDPRGVLGLIRSQPEVGLDLVRQDTMDGLSKWFQPEAEEPDEEAWVGEREQSGKLGKTSFAVTWKYTGRHVSGGQSGTPLAGLPPTGRKVIVRGITVLGVDEDTGDQFEVRRYVDWAAVFAQLGLTLNWRVPLPVQEPSG